MGKDEIALSVVPLAVVWFSFLQEKKTIAKRKKNGANQFFKPILSL